MFPAIARGVAAATLAIGIAACTAGTSGTPAPAPTLPNAPATAATTAATSAPGTAPGTASTSAPGQAPTSAAGTTTAAPVTDDRAAVEKAFGDLRSALSARDFTAACKLITPRAGTALVAAANARGAKAGTCEEALRALYATPERSRLMDQAATSAKIDDVVVSGDTATVTLSGVVRDQARNGLVIQMQRIDGQWQLRGGWL